ncbi:hypothetical protein [Rubricoccus marinus]|uniref:hypothetical protein n=1 Tax=Rubricoccus marinus TaxID=716817 RepID=UPI001C530999|nr:hypothetical protein [Rubricoccus marinus]
MLVVLLLSLGRALGGSPALSLVAFFAFAVAHAVVSRRFAALGPDGAQRGPLGIPDRLRGIRVASRTVPSALRPLLALSALWIVMEWIVIGLALAMLFFGVTL